MPLLSDISLLAAKVEGTVGTAETLTAAEAVYNAYDIECTQDIAIEPRQDPGSFNKIAGTPGARSGSCKFKVWMNWDGTATEPDWAAVLFPACGFVESSGVFTPRSEALGSNVKSVTIAKYFDGVKKSLAGAVGNFRIVYPSGRACYIEFEFTGVWQAPVDATILAPTEPTDAATRFASATVTYDSVALKVEQVAFESGNDIILREDASTAGGYISGLITSRHPKLTLNPEATLIGTDDPYGDLIAGTEAAFALSVTAAGNDTIDLSVPKAQITSINEGDRGGMVIDDIEMMANKNGATADQEATITFTVNV